MPPKPLPIVKAFAVVKSPLPGRNYAIVSLDVQGERVVAQRLLGTTDQGLADALDMMANGASNWWLYQDEGEL